MDEPTTGLHFADVERLIGCFDAVDSRRALARGDRASSDARRRGGLDIEIGPAACGPRRRDVRSGRRS